MMKRRKNIVIPLLLIIGMITAISLLIVNFIRISRIESVVKVEAGEQIPDAGVFYKGSEAMLHMSPISRPYLLVLLVSMT